MDLTAAQRLPGMAVEYQQIRVDAPLEDDFRQLIRLAVREDFDRQIDWTTVSLVPEDRIGKCQVAVREAGVAAGLVTLPWIIDEMNLELRIETLVEDGARVAAGQIVAQIEGSARDILSSERIVLNTLCRMFGIATFTDRFVQQISGTKARLYDTRKTTLGWRRMDKYAVRCGGGTNHRLGLFDAFLIKDNHLALAGPGEAIPPSEAVAKAKSWAGGESAGMKAPQIVEVEVDTLEQFQDVLPAGPDIILLDNFSLDDLRQAVAIRNEKSPQIELEASGNVKLETIREIAETGVDRISSGALTHAARWLDLGLDWTHDFS
ncbi:Nicotinate-nucleotide pyrophosphorylase [carboxylating] [Rosistilla carotiformis]|uniref:Probable nicotinate-nucleotide pyrophosphorylase [carboxylating] n=2 Tax=Rosistilla TaxID=2795779 RepID=A0A518JXB4_9BACT|nr:carboxylating nicotinate-nucleotide diphosphorylase [Rosistilla carotiformis]QDV70180.1 Nicotinate-nucleotide pyrophosphorylase [carboxylating] [Rosistilla carotiformis]